jgi:hypothetical protein
MKVKGIARIAIVSLAVAAAIAFVFLATLGVDLHFRPPWNK